MIALFGGTTESWEIADHLRSKSYDFILFTATDFSDVPDDGKGKIIRQAKPLNQEEMDEAFKTNLVRLVIDATHPYAVEVSMNLMAVCHSLSVSYYRFERPKTTISDLDFVSRFPDYDQTIDYLKTTEGNILLSTGSNSLQLFAEKIPLDRLYVRILPIAEILQKTIAIGIKKDHILAMKGPFSEEMNIAMMKYWHISYLVSKDSGVEGGMEEKIRSVQIMQNKLIIIDKPKIYYTNTCSNLQGLYKKIDDKMEAI